MRDSTFASSGEAGGSRWRSSPAMRTRQVEQRPRPPQTEAWGMPATPAHLEDREACRLGRAATVAVVETHDAGAPFPEVAQRSGGDRADQQGERRIFQAGRDRIEVGDLPGRGDVCSLEKLLEKAGTLRQLGDVAQRDGRAREAGGRDQQGEAIEKRQPVAIPGLQAQREVQADAAMRPDDQRQRELPQDARPAAGDERAQHPKDSPTGRRRASPRVACRRHGRRRAG
jgi:hypothetical protein